MSTQTIGIIIGGILPAFFFGLSGVLAKPATQAGIGTGIYILFVGAAIASAGLLFHILDPDTTLSLRSGIFAALVGLTWAIGAGLVAIALMKYGLPIAKLAPLYNMNSLVAVLIGLIFLAEWREVNSTQLVIGSILIAIGGSLVATS